MTGILPAWHHTFQDNSTLFNDYFSSVSVGMVDGISGGSMEFLSLILIVDQKTPSSTRCNFWEINSIKSPSINALQEEREMF